MNKNAILDFILAFFANDKSNIISAEAARKPAYAGMRIYNAPLVAYAAADDPYLRSLKDNAEANIDLMQPGEWLADAHTVVSVFSPYTERIRTENRGGDWPSDAWLHGRIQGHECGQKMILALADELTRRGHAAIVPSEDSRMRVFMPSAERDGAGDPVFTSNWSERHVAYAAGLGTFSLSKGLITERGVAGRYTSLITTHALEPTARAYTGLTDYCVMCGDCARNCPAQAIDIRTGKDHKRCSDFLNKTRAAEAPYYGCGKCQCGVPCEDKAPKS